MITRHTVLFGALAALVSGAAACGGEVADRAHSNGAEESGDSESAEQSSSSSSTSGSSGVSAGDCGPRPAESRPEGADCSVNAQCESGHVCERVMGNGQWTCMNGQWMSSDMYWMSCVPEPTLEACGADPSRDACSADADCGDPTRVYCDLSESTCVSSSCSCADGTWTCTPDCKGQCRLLVR